MPKQHFQTDLNIFSFIDRFVFKDFNSITQNNRMLSKFGNVI